MRKKNVVGKDKKKRQQVRRYELKKKFLNCIIFHGGFRKYKKYAFYYRAQLPKNSSYVRLKNYCLLTGRNKGVYRKFKLSRIKVREFLALGMLPNYLKRS